MKHDFFSLLERFSQLSVVVAGEAVLHSQVRGKADRLNLDAPAPVVRVSETLDLPGGAANTAANLRRFGARVELVSVIGEDAEGEALLSILRGEKVGVRGVFRHAGRQTLLTRRVYAGDQLVVRYDQGTGDPVDAETEDRLLAALEALCPRADVVVLSDYGQGLLTRRLIEGLTRLQKRAGCPVVADTRRLAVYRGLKLAAVRPGGNSALELLGERAAFQMGGNGAAPQPDLLARAGEKTLEILDAQLAAVTLDENGALVIERVGSAYRTYAPEMSFTAVSGAGDAFVAGLALALAAGAQASAAAEIASAAASIVVKYGGGPACCIDELRGYLSGDKKVFQNWDALGARLGALRRQGKRIVFTNGVFDILHSAHVTYLNQAKQFGDILVIGVNTDESVRQLKGPERPVNTLLERCRVLAGLSCVDFVTQFNDVNPINLIHVVRPDVYVKGGDYTRETLPEAEVVERYGGVLQIVPYIADHSTSSVIERIRASLPQPPAPPD